MSTIAAACLVSCGGTPAPASQSQLAAIEPSPVAAPARSDPTRYHMRRQYADLRLIERVLIAGKLDDGAILATLLTREHEDPAFHAFAPEIHHVAHAADELSRADNLDQALRRVAVVAVECAACHARSGARVVFGPAPSLPDDLMPRHAWATDRLWEGMIGGDIDRWRRGLAVLSESSIADGGGLRDLARAQLLEATGPVDSDRRAVGYGKLLIVCASCHVQLGVKIP